MKHQTKHFDTISGKVWKINGGKCTMRGKIPGKMIPVFGPPPASKPVTIADGLNEVKGGLAPLPSILILHQS